MSKIYEYYDKHGFYHVWRIVPAFMEDGYRVFHKEEYKDEIWTFHEAVFKNEEEAEKRIERFLSCALQVKQIVKYTVRETD